MKKLFIKINNLSKIYKQGGEILKAVDDLNLEISEGEIDKPLFIKH